MYCFTTIPRAAASGSKRHSGQLTRKSCQISAEKRPNQTLLVIGQLVVGLSLGGVAVSKKAHSPSYGAVWRVFVSWRRHIL